MTDDEKQVDNSNDKKLEENNPKENTSKEDNKKPETSKENKKIDNATLAKISKDEDKKLRVRDGFEKKVIKLEEILSLDEKAQTKLIRETLEDIYDEAYIVSKKNILRVIGLTCNKETEEDEIYLPGKLRVKKTEKDLIFYVKKDKLAFLWILLFLGALIIATIGATYSAVLFLSRSEINKDIDGDGIPDINLDYNGDYIADINVDTNKDNKPNTNIDYKGNRKSVFNIDIDGDGNPDYNIVSDATENPESCAVNCDIDGDGWPDINVDIDGDGKPDLDIDTDHDLKPDINLDVNGDTLCDVMCDTDDDGICDKNCITAQSEGIHSGTTIVSGDPKSDAETAKLQIDFKQGNSIKIYDVFPDDQYLYSNDPTENYKIPDKVFIVENMSNYALMYNIEFVIGTNSFTSQNFKYKLTSTNGGASFDWRVAPFTSQRIMQKVIIPARVAQTYTMSFKLQGMNIEQNYDQGKEFSGYLNVVAY